MRFPWADGADTMGGVNDVVGYVTNGGVQIAYKVVGSGPKDLVVIYEWGTSLDWVDGEGWVSGCLADMAEFGRCIYIDLRGTGLSERVDTLPPIEEWADDIRTVMDAVGSESATLVGWGQSAQLCILFAAMYPQRSDALVVCNGFARLTRDVDHPHGYPPRARAILLNSIRDYWGTGIVNGFTSPSYIATPERTEDMGRSERAAATPNVAARFQAAIFGVDVRQVLPSISTPTLVIHASKNQWVRPEHGRYLADHVEGARYVEIDGVDHALYGPEDRRQWVPAMREFLADPRPSLPTTRSLTTIAFTDIVDSTRIAADLGDAKWRHLLEDHDWLSREAVERAGGRVVKSTGDGMMATFDGPARAIDCLRGLGRHLADSGLTIRAGVHTGEVEILGDDIGGLGVHIAARVAAQAGSGQIFVSSTVRDLVAGSGMEFEDEGERELKGVPGVWRLLRVV